MKIEYLLSIALIICLGASNALAQEVSGVVTDQTKGNSIPGVNILVKGTSVGTATGSDGKYSLSVPSLQDTLVFSFIGYQTQEVPINGRSTVDVALPSEALKGEELVVVGYGTQQRQDLTGSISSIRSDEFEDGVSSSVDQLIGNKVAGVRMVQSSSQPGSGASINIRGASSINAGTGPLYVVDGLPIDKSSAADAAGGSFTSPPGSRNPLNSINPGDIESIEILKDASATAIYGSRGANGVVLITTKQGQNNQFNVDYNGYAGFQSVANRMNVMSATEYRQVLNGIIDAGGGNESERVPELQGSGTNWQNLIYDDGAPVTGHNLSFSGGSDMINYHASLNYFGQQGIIKNSSMDRYNARLNFGITPSDKFNIKVNLNTAYIKDDYVANGFGINYYAGSVQTAINFDPTLQVRDGDGEYVRSQYISLDNPIAILNDEESFANTYRTLGTIKAEYNIVPQLSANLQVGGDFENRRRDSYVGTETQFGAAANGEATIQQGQQTNYLIEGTLNYNESFGIHSIDAVAGMTFQRFLTDRNFMTAQDFPSDATFTYNMGLANPELVEINSNRFSNELVSYIGRVNYNLMDKYLFTATIRADGSSRFGEDNRFGIFPSGAFGWRLNEETFMENVEAISNLKLRASWGKTGNQAIGNLQFRTSFGPGPDAVLGDQIVGTIDPSNLANPALKWETTEQIDFGVDIGLWEDRISGSFDYFIKETSDMLVSIPVPSSTGFGSRLENIGSIENTGIELSIDSRNITTSDFNWRTSFNVSFLNNEVKDLGETIDRIIIGGPGQVGQAAIIQEGDPLRSFYGYKVEGIWQTDDDYSNAPAGVEPGSIKYQDTNGDGELTGEDRTLLGDSFPDVTWAITNNLNYKNFNFRFSLEGVEGVSMLNVNMIDTFFPVNFRRNKLAEPYLNRWTPENPTNKWPSFVNPLSQGQKAVNSYTVQDASYIRLKTVRLSYSLPQSLLGGTFHNASVYGMAENLFTIDDYAGPDPAANPNSSANYRIDWNAAPLVRTFTLGVNLGF
jgi:TonB-linked SusC/RagA family outer membrane protein